MAINWLLSTTDSMSSIECSNSPFDLLLLSFCSFRFFVFLFVPRFLLVCSVLVRRFQRTLFCSLVEFVVVAVGVSFGFS